MKNIKNIRFAKRGQHTVHRLRCLQFLLLLLLVGLFAPTLLAQTVTTYATGFSDPARVSFDAAGNMYVPEVNTGSIKKVTPGGSTTTTLVTGMSNPRSIALDATNNLYVADNGLLSGSSNTSLWKVTPAGVLSTFVNIGANTNGIVKDAAGNFYVTKASVNDVRKITPSGTITTFATGFNFPYQLDIDAAGNLYVNSANSRAILKVTPAGVVSTFYDFSASDANCNGVALDAAGNVYLSFALFDFSSFPPVVSNTLKKVDASGANISTFVDFSTTQIGDIARWGDDLYVSTATDILKVSLPSSCTPLPTAYTVTGSGTYACGGAGLAVGLSDSDTGVDYQLKKDGINQGSAVAGTGSALDFGAQTTGTYTVVATIVGGCSGDMTGSAIVEEICPKDALAFDGTNDYVALGNPTSLQLTTGTVEFWIKTNSTAPNDVLVYKNGFYALLMLNGILNVYDEVANVATQSVNIADNVWHHVAMTFAPGANNAKLYVDGTVTNTFTLSNAVNTGNLFISTFNAAQACAGTFDELRFWNVVRTEAEIQASMSCELAGTETGLQAYYKFNQSSSTTLTDATSNGNNGTLTNFALSGSASNWVSPGGVSCTPTASAVITGNVVACGSSQLTASSATALTAYMWSTGATTASITVTSSGTYSVTTTFAGGVTATASVAVTINPAMVTPVISGSATACDVVNLSASAAGATSFSWSNGVGTAANTFANSGTYTVTVTNANGCTATASQAVTINKATASISGALSGCDEVTLTATGGTLYSWTGGATGATATFDEAETYTVTVTDANGCTAIATHTIFVISTSKTYYLDSDGDGYGDASNPIQSCSPLVGYIQLGLDCDDTNALINPGAEETCDNIDNNCNGILIEQNCPGSNAPVALECSTRSTTVVLTGRVFFNYGSFTNARNTVTKSSSTIGQPCVGLTIGDDQNVGFGFWTRFLLSPSAPTVVATQGDLPDRVQINWSADPLSPAASTYKIYRDNALLATVDNETFAFIDFNVIAGQFYTYEIAGTNQFGEGKRGGSLGFLNPNGVITGQIKSFSGNPVVNTTVKLAPTLGAAVEFNGLSTIFAEYSPKFPREKFTLSCWAKIGDGNPTTENTGIFDLGSDRGKNWWLHAVTPANGSKGVKFGIGKNLTTKTEMAYTLPDSTKNNWHHYAATYNGSSVLLYVDGELVNTAVGEITADSTVLFIGKRSDEGGYFKGKMDELRFYNRQLAQTEIQMTMNQTVSPNADGLTSYWKYDEGTGSKGFDLTLNKVKTFFCGATWTTDKPNVVNAGISDETGFYKIEGVNYGSGTTFTARPSKDFHFNQSLEFNAANQSYATLTNFDLPDSSTIEITVKNFDFSANQVILSKEGHFELGLNAGNLFLKMGGSTQLLGAIGMGFHRLSFTLKQSGGSTEATFYKNGTLVGSYTFSGVASNFSGGTPWTLGKNAGGNYFTGLIDEVAFFSTLLSLPDIQTFANIGTNVTHPKLSSYFNLNEGDLAVLHDMGTALTGSGALYGASWSTVAKITETLPHEFTPSSRLVTLNPYTPSSDQIDFTDQSTIPVSGYVRFENTDCFQRQVEILVNGESNIPQIFTDADGKFIVDLEPGESVRLTPKFEQKDPKTNEVLTSHSFYPAFWDLTSVSSPVAGILFRNQTKRKVYGQMAGNETCRKSVVPDGAIVKVKIATLNGCYERVKQLPASGKFVFEGVPPDSVTVAVIEHSNPIIYTFFQNLGGATLDLKNQNDTTDFIYLAPPQVEISPMPVNSCGTPMFEMASAGQNTIKVFEQYDGGVCYLDSAKLTINNDIAGISQFDTVMTGGQFKYKYKAGYPNIVPPYLRTLQVTAEAHDEQATTTLSAVVLGKRARTTTFASTSPEMPTLILRDPPGDASSAFMESGETTCQNWAFSSMSGENQDEELSLSLGADLTTSVGLGAEVELEINATAEFGFQHSGTTSQLTSNEMETCITTTKVISTGDNDQIVGSNMGGDVYVGGAVNFIFGITDDLLFDTAACEYVLDKSLVVLPDGFATTFIYSEYQIKNVVIPNLLTINDTTSAERWQAIIDRNTQLKNEATFIENLSFDGGVTYEQSTTTEVTKTVTNEWTVEFSNGFSTELGIEVNGIGLGGSINMAWTTSESKTNTNTNATAKTVGFTLADDDIGDNFTVNILQDKAYGTPVFKLVSGQSQCPHEPNTQPREGTSIAADKQVAVNVPMNDVAVFKLTLGNISQSEETKVYSLEGLQENNPDGAIIRFNGQPALSVAVPFGQPVVVTMTVARGPVAFDYNNLRIGFFSDCEIERADALGIDPPAEQNKELEFDVFFLEPCSPVDVSFPLQDWVFTNGMGTSMNVTLGGYNTSDPDLELIRAQYRRTQGDGAWINIAEIPKADLGPVFEIVPWALPTSFKDGLYEIRAVTQCFSGALNPGISYVIKGKIEREAPEVFGTPEPADGVLSRGDEISIMFTEPIRCDQLIPADLFNNNNVGLYNTRTGELVDAIITCSGDKITIVPNVPNQFIENEILRVQVNNIKDLAGNNFVEKKWEFFVDRNPIRWEGGDIKVTKGKSDEVVVIRKIVNDGGQATDYDLKGIPTWVHVFPSSGTLPPGALADITFLFDSNMVFGNYLDTIQLDAPEGDEPLIVNCRVMCESPDWDFNPATYPHTMNFSLKLDVEGTLSTDEEDIVAAFIDGELRGTAKVQLLPTLPPLGTQYMVFLTVYGDADDDGKPVKLEIWDASACLRYGEVIEQFDFEVDNVIGTIGTPTILHTNSMVRRDIPLTTGWNWISFNLLHPDPALNASLASLKYPANDLIKGQSSFSEYFSGSWIGSLAALNNRNMFQFRADQPDTIQMRGALIDPASLSIPISAGWNWIGYVPNYALTVSQALAGLTPLNGDIIKGQTSFAQYIAGFGWLGSLQFMEPPKGYQLKISLPGTLTYPPQPQNKSNGEPAPSLLTPRSSLWQVDATQFEHSMTLVGMLSAGGQNTTLAGHEIGAFAGGQLRGSAQAIYIEPLDAYAFFLTTFANTSGEQLQFKLYDSTTGQVVELSEKMYFVADLHQGGIQSPIPFTLKTSGVGEVAAVQYLEVQPNPFDDATTILFAADHAQEVRLLISDATGRTVVSQKIAAMSGLNNFRWEANSASAGVYFVRLETGEGTAVRKVVKE